MSDMARGFAFDPMAGEEASTLDCLTILEAHMNPDFAIGNELLKKSGIGKASPSRNNDWRSIT